MVICKLDRRNCIFNDFTILLMDIQADHRYKERTAAANSGLAKVAGSFFVWQFFVNLKCVLRIKFSGKIATFAKPQTVSGQPKGRHQRIKGQK